MRSRLILIAVAGLVGCSRQAPPAEVVVVGEATSMPAPVDADPPPAPGDQAGPAQVAPAAVKAPPAEFQFPTDTAGLALPGVVASPAPASLPVERFGAAPAPRATSNRTVNPDALPKVPHAPPPLLPPRPAAIRPVAPLERVPFDIGFGATAVPARPTLPNPPGQTTRARDVALPPPLAPVGRQLPDRASLEDPTADLGNAGIVNRSPTPALSPAGFLKVTLPDPFELAEQVKPKIDPAAEPRVTPVPVNPRRPK